ncbi:MAG: transposase [Ruminococcaceae bacterium]|nr:transposase [Oscillospiraceae bacterium]
MWLPEGEPVPDHATFARFRKRCGKEIEDLFYQDVFCKGGVITASA